MFVERKCIWRQLLRRSLVEEMCIDKRWALSAAELSIRRSGSPLTGSATDSGEVLSGQASLLATEWSCH